VIFTAAIASAAYTRTADGGNSWTASDHIGIFMSRAGAGGDSANPADLLADNVRYRATPGNHARTASFAPADATRTIYYPAGDGAAVDFTAYYPYGKLIDGKLQIDLNEQTTTRSLTDLDVLWAEAAGATAEGGPVAFTFNHVLSKITFDVTVGDGSAEGADVTGVVIGSCFHATLDPKTGSVVPSIPQEFPAGKTAPGTFTSLLIPQPLGDEGREAIFTVGGRDYVWRIPDNEVFEAGVHYTYPVKVNRYGLVVGEVAIGPWNGGEEPDNSGGTGVAEKAIDQPEANSYIVAPGSTPILIPVSRANRAADPECNLGGSTDGLGGVTEGNYTLEPGWSDPGVIEEMAVQGDRVYVKPGTATGNAVILLKVGRQVKWSWHIWATFPVGEKTDTGTGLVWMDRNLGAASTAYSASGRNGLYYQWGRKDAFPATGEVDTADTFTTTADLVNNPTVFATNSTTYTGSAGAVSWNDNRGNKTIYDPCPAGWKVPPATVIRDGVEKNSWGAPRDWADFTNRGRTFRGTAGGLNHFYPAAGYRDRTAGRVTGQGAGGYWWSSTPRNGGGSLHVTDPGVTTAGSSSYGAGLSVRCIRETATPPLTPLPLTPDAPGINDWGGKNDPVNPDGSGTAGTEPAT
jgi:hypothetical protein